MMQGPIGQKLFQEAAAFYSWYISSWYMAGGSPAVDDLIRTNLSLIKRIAEVSLRGGNFLSERDELRSLEAFSDILGDLNNGSLRKQDLPSELRRVLWLLTEKNPKARLIMQTTESEYYFCIDPPEGQPAEWAAEYQSLFDRIVKNVTPQMHEIHAQALCRGLSGPIDSPQAVAEAIKNWI